MNIEEKRNLIKANKDAAVVALNAYLDQIYNLTDTFFDEEGKRLAVLTPDPKLENFIASTRSDAARYEKVREKLVKNDFNLSLLEINEVGLAFLFVLIVWEKQINNLRAASDQAKTIFNSLVDKESKNIDFSN